MATSEGRRRSEVPTKPTGETPNKLHWNIVFDIPMPCWPTLSEISYFKGGTILIFLKQFSNFTKTIRLYNIVNK